MAPNALKFLAVDGQCFNLERIGKLIAGALAISVFIWLIVLSVQIGSIEKHERGSNSLKLYVINDKLLDKTN